ncbi:hypothetical protein SEA_GUDMIT_33 [Gordonia phage Gudmit]|nr:hypothetical protein SEA_GUDMIT_33 [Gordonia phage Gudmit]
MAETGKIYTPDEAEDLLEGISPAPWTANGVGIISDASDTILAKGADGNMHPCDVELAAAAPDLARTVIAQAAEIERLSNTEIVSTRMTPGQRCQDRPPSDPAVQCARERGHDGRHVGRIEVDGSPALEWWD